MFLFTVCASAQTFNIVDYGATPNDATDDDVPAIQAALDAAGAGSLKGTVKIPWGFYDLSSYVDVPRGVTLCGDGRNRSFLRAKTGFSGAGGTIPTLVYVNGQSAVTIRDLGFLGNDQVAEGFLIVDSVNCTIRDCYFDAHLQRMGLMAGATEKISILNNVSEGGTLAENLAIADADYVLVMGNTFTRPSPSNGLNGIELGLSAPGLVIGTKIIGNTFVNMGAAGVGLGGDSGTIIEANTFTACGYGAYTGTWFSVPTTNLVVKGNTVNGPAFGGFLIHSEASSVTLTANTVKNSAGHGIIVEGSSNTLGLNVITGSALQGIHINGSYNTLTGNQIKGSGENQPAIGIAGGHNSLTGNVCRGQAMGLQLEAGADANVYGLNDFSDNWFIAVLNQGTNNKTVTLQ